MKVLILLVLLFLEVYDVGITYLIGLEYERNPFMACIWLNYGFGAIVAFKLGTVLLAAVVALIVESLTLPSWIELLYQALLLTVIVALIYVCINNTLIWMIIR